MQTPFFPKPLVLVVQETHPLLSSFGQWVRSHGCDVCACDLTEVPPIRVWSDRFVGAVLPDREHFPSIPIDAFFTCEGFRADFAKRLLESWIERKGGVGVTIRPGRTRPVWGSYRLVRGCGRALIRDEAIRDGEHWVA